MDASTDAGARVLFPGNPSPRGVSALPRASVGRGLAPEHCGTRELLEIVAARRTESSAAAWDFLRRSRAPAAEWAELLGIPARSALRVACAFELGRRVARSEQPPRPSIQTPRDAFDLMADLLRGRDRETVIAAYLDGRHRLLHLHEVSVGTATASLIHPREVFGPALRAGACAVVIAHNHPSGDPEPSAEDHGVTERLVAAGELLGIPLLDHLVVGGGSFVSLRGRGAFDSRTQLLGSARPGHAGPSTPSAVPRGAGRAAADARP